MECTFARINQIAVLEKQNKNLNPQKFFSVYVFSTFFKVQKIFLATQKKKKMKERRPRGVFCFFGFVSQELQALFIYA